MKKRYIFVLLVYLFEDSTRKLRPFAHFVFVGFWIVYNGTVDGSTGG